MKKSILYGLLLVSISVFSQKTIYNYKYIIVPEKFDFLKRANQFQTSSLTKFLLKKHGFTTYYNNENLPEDLSKNRCLALTAKLIDKSGMFVTKNLFEFKDCNNNTVFTSGVGESREKKYERAYRETIREAFESIKKLNYKYIPFKEEIDINKDKAIVEVVKKNKPVVAVTTKNTTTIIKKEGKVEEKKESISTLYAQPKDYGFQLVDNTPKVVFKILKTEKKGLFIIKDRNGILYQKEGKWVAEYYTGEVLVKETFQIKF